MDTFIFYTHTACGDVTDWVIWYRVFKCSLFWCDRSITVYLCIYFQCASRSGQSTKSWRGQSYRPDGEMLGDTSQKKSWPLTNKRKKNLKSENMSTLKLLNELPHPTGLFLWPCFIVLFYIFLTVQHGLLLFFNVLYKYIWIVFFGRYCYCL